VFSRSLSLYLLRERIAEERDRFAAHYLTIRFVSSIKHKQHHTLSPLYNRTKIKEGTLLSQNWKLAVLKFDFGEELYIPEYLPCFECAATTTTNSNSTAARPCDYSSRDSCGKSGDCNEQGEILSFLELERVTWMFKRWCVG